MSANMMDKSVKKAPLRLFQGYGIELEYMIVDQETLDVKPMTDRLIHQVTGNYQGEVNRGMLSWTNELALHVLEFKTTEPAESLAPLAEAFQEEVRRVNTLLEPHSARLMPTAMHPWMDPIKEMRLWPHDYNAVYDTFNRIFNCRGHGWANLQSVHINLPFGDEPEFVRLHAAIRLILPLIPALAASSPIVEGQVSGLHDSRLEFYRNNAIRIPSLTGSIIPEVCLSFKDYEEKIFQRIYADIAPHDPENLLQNEWLNARGAITRFDRNAIEIRLIDIQETPIADLAIALAITSAVRALVNEMWVPLHFLHRLSESSLRSILLTGIRSAENAKITDAHFLSVFGWNKGACNAGELWAHIISQTVDARVHQKSYETLQFLLNKGTLATRLLRVLGPNPDHQVLKRVYAELCGHLQQGTLFEGEGHA